ncbi:LOW QUALITY PROTEIN: uncharacterized protein ACBT57_018809 [Dama dama]
MAILSALRVSSSYPLMQRPVPWPYIKFFSDDHPSAVWTLSPKTVQPETQACPVSREIIPAKYPDALLTVAKHVISSAQSIREGLDGTNHPDILSPLQDQVQRFDMAKRQTYFILLIRLEEAETHAKQLLDKVLASDGFQAPSLWEESIKDGCLLWSVAVQHLLQGPERLSRRQGLFLWPLRQAVKDLQGLQEGLAQAADVSQRLQKAARLSGLLCADEQVKGKTCSVGEVHVLTDTLLNVAQILAFSPRPSPSLDTCFELLCLELTLQARVLTGHLSSINADYEHGIVAGGQESGPCQEDFLMTLEDTLILTKEVAQQVPVLQGHPEDWFQQEWAAQAHYAVSQLWAGVSGGAEASSVDSPGAAPRDTTESSAGTCAALPVIASTVTELGTAGGSSRVAPPAAQPGCRQKWTHLSQRTATTNSGNRITQITQEMAKEALLVAQSLRRRGCISVLDLQRTKDQLIASARKIATLGQTFAKLIHFVAKNCVDHRCPQELLCVVDQIETMSSQLQIFSSVEASLTRSKSSEELLVENAQQLLCAVSKPVRATEAGFRQTSPDPEEPEVAAFCVQWRRKLLRHRLQETSNLVCDELILQKTSTKGPLTLIALV